MPLGEEDRATIDAFIEYIEGATAHDERYGEVHGVESDDESKVGVRFEAGAASWFELVVLPDDLAVQVAFVTTDQAEYEEIAAGGEADGETVQGLVHVGFREAGLDLPDAEVEQHSDDEGEFGFTTKFSIEYFFELDQESYRNRALSMLEAYLVAFGPMLDFGEDEYDDDDSDDLDDDE